MIGKTNVGGGENITAELNEQTTKLDNLLLTLEQCGTFQRMGLYVWEKYTAQGGTFEEYVVSNDAIAYPNGGTKDGKWYQKLEDVSAEVNAQSPLIQTILDSLVGKVEGANITPESILQGYCGYRGRELVQGNYVPHGKYVWKKYSAITINATDNSVDGSSRLVLSSTDVDLSKWTANDLVGITFTIIPNGYSGFPLKIISSTQVDASGTIANYTWNPTSKMISINTMITTSKFTVSPAIAKTYVTQVVSDSETAYPDGGMQGGFWYERVKDTVSAYGIDFGEVTLDSSLQAQLVVEHSLGVVPKHIFIIADIGNTVNYNNVGRSYAIGADNYGSFQNYSFSGSYQSIERYLVSHTKTNKTISFKSNGGYWSRGTYKWFALA